MKKQKGKKKVIEKFLQLLIVVMLASNVVLFCVTSLVTRSTLTSQTQASGENLLTTNLKILDQFFDDVDNLATAILYNDDLIMAIETEDDTRTMSTLQMIERLCYHSRKDLKVTFYKLNEPKNAYSIYQNGQYLDNHDFRESSWYEKVQESGTERTFITNIYSDYQDGDQNEYVHSLIYRIRDSYSGQEIGYLRIDLDLNALKSRLISQYVNVDAMVIFNSQNQILFADRNEKELGVTLAYEDAAPGQVYSTETETQMITYAISEFTGWDLVIAVAKTQMNAGIWANIRVLAIGLLIVSLLSFLIGNTFSKAISRNLERLISGMQRVKAGELSTQIEKAADDEIGMLIEEFNETVREMNDLMQKVETKQALLDKAEIMALQQQINPHFIYNILETIMGLASEGMDQEVIEVSQCMNSMLRYNTKFVNHTSIRAEMDQVYHYIRVLELRFEDRFRTEYDIDEACLSADIVKFSLQPLVENAMNHGFQNTVQQGLLQIRIHRAGEFVEIEIRDNGCGILPNRLQQLQKQISEEGSSNIELANATEGTGMINVHLRLRLHFGRAYHMELKSEVGKGTAVCIRIPFIVEREDADVSCHDSR